MMLLRGGPEGVRRWNASMEADNDPPDLGGAFLINADLRGVDLRGTHLAGASFFRADLRQANLAGALAAGADFRGTDLRRAVLEYANLSGARFGNTLIACDLSKVIGLDNIVHVSRSIVDVDMLLSLPAEFPTVFLQGCGLPEEEIAHFQARQRDRRLMPACFVCFCPSEQRLATLLHKDLQAAGVRCWRWDHEANICEDLVDPAEPVLRPGDKVVLLVSRRSLSNEVVNRTIDQLIAEEDRATQRQSTPCAPYAQILYPLRVDAFVFEERVPGRPAWQHPCREAVVGRTIIDATAWDTTPGRYQQARDELLRALKDSRPK